MDILKLSPLPAQIEECINSTDISKDVELLRLVSTLLKYTVPEAYVSLPASTQTAIACVFRSAIGLGNLTARIAMFSRLKTDLHRDISRALDAHMRLLDKVLAPGLVAALINSASTVTQREVEKLLFKGKTYAIVQEAVANFSNFHVPLVLRNMDGYTAYLTREILSIDDLAPFIMLLLSLGDSAPFFDTMFSLQNGPYFHRNLNKLKRFERKHVLIKFLDYSSSRFLDSRASAETAAAISVLNRLILDNSIWDELLLEKVISRYSYALNTMVSLLISNVSDLLTKFLAAWGASAVLTNEPIVKQGYRTHLLLCLCAQMSPMELQGLMKLSEFLSAITSRLSSLSNQVKFLGVFFADNLCKMADAPPIFDMNDLSDMRLLDIPTEFIKNTDFSLSIEACWEILELPQIIQVETGDIPTLEKFNLHDAGEDGAKIDEYMSDEEDDPTLATRDHVPKPIYVRDLLSYLSVEPKDKNAYEKRRLALQVAPTLLRQKLAFGSEVSFYALDLLAQLVGLTNHYEEKDFETLRLNAMIAVVVSYPEVTTELCKLLLTGDYSLQQRLSLLSSMSFAARALRGYKDEVVERSFHTTQFPTEMLPKRLHDQYAAADYGYSRIENTIQNDLMRESSEEARDEILGGKVLRVSARLKKQPAALEVSKDQITTFPDVVGRLFFFPLVAVWYESGGINIGHYTPVLIAHYVRTLSLILHCAYPAATDLKEMAGEYLTLVTPLLQTVNTEQLQVIESIVTGVLLICETVDHTYLVTTFDGNLHIIQSVIAQWWDSLIEDRVKSLCAGLLLRLNQLRENLERTIMDQLNGALYA
ncbi:hypothetical protein HF325_004565 [Metschnikowia pulcherrima]|uniref:Telomere length regulation protein conserved domain-containing protein n=1 Tax=Metschnikowia pulcherrima TaxID=27326 RepID=A0A8H7L8L4_9ASCO|nr:hypothetical protein HF325_004565 [Metschnikowia pulcherrima]